MSAHYPFVTTPLVAPVDDDAAKAYERELKLKEQSRGLPARPNQLPPALGWVIVVGIISFMLMIITQQIVAAIRSTDPSWFRVMIFVVFPVVVIVAGIMHRPTTAKRRERQYRLHQFAVANNMSYEGSIANPRHFGMIFDRGHSRVASDIVRGVYPRFVEFGNYQYKTGKGRNEHTFRWGYVAVKLDVPLPHIVLDAVGNNSVFGSNLPTRFDRNQRLSLEGDFDRYFELYCPEGYEVDALYLFTPDIMARFIDSAAELDVEIVDDWMFLYTTRDASTLDAATWAWLFGAVGAMLDKFAQWARWRDDRLGHTAISPHHPVASSPDLLSTAAPTPGVPPLAADGISAPPPPFAVPTGMLTPPPGVAAPGRRLRTKSPWLTVAIVVAVFLVMFFPTPLFRFFGFLLSLLPSG